MHMLFQVEGTGTRVTRESTKANRALVTIAIQCVGNRVGVDAFEMHLQALYDALEISISGLCLHMFSKLSPRMCKDLW